ncbi:transporter [Vibrio sp. 10N.286.49.C2]|uniref:AEC family transporter n=1 Tax=unclassified Vibrio TaxID=2614977 RepID=UPI000C823C2D|nr:MULTISPECIES: AEC family transporter [unclassified Vibrio]PMH35179.1 transporter [Vibrio sp. 10N.286.49.C2]PMH57122.1 transporter [Vibrio sp. 10N.286.49.B1]PMH83592.1 transporter [Vibrio sp. 10N.286.48.B7]
MNFLLDQLHFSLSITGPICLMLILGVVFKRVGLINENFIEVASKLVFQVTLPAMLFLSIVTSEHDFSAASQFVGFSLIASITFFIFTTITVNYWFKNSPDKGVIIQGGYRSNTAIIGLAYVANAYGDQGVAVAALYVAATTFLYNIQAVICLTPKSEASGAQAGKVMVRTLTKNPLIIAIVLGMAFYLLSIPVPTIAVDAGNYFARMTLPLALLCTGGSLNLSSMKKEQGASWFATGYKLVLAPLCITFAAYLMGFKGIEMGVIFFMNAAPVAAASYVMARAMGANSTLAANIIAFSTVLSAITCTLGIVILSSMNLL